MQLSIFSSEERPASRSASQGLEPDWLTLGATSCSPILPLLQDIAPVGWSGRMSPASFPHGPAQKRRAIYRKDKSGKLTKFPISAASWRDFSNSGMGSPTECLTLSSVEHLASKALSRSDGAVCSLSDILETGDVPQRYYLTARACAGILRRAEKRGKELPAVLLRALQQVAEGLSEPETPEGKTQLSQSKRIPEMSDIA